jgi:hypothetical protein
MEFLSCFDLDPSEFVVFALSTLEPRTNTKAHGKPNHETREIHETKSKKIPLLPREGWWRLPLTGWFSLFRYPESRTPTKREPPRRSGTPPSEGGESFLFVIFCGCLGKTRHRRDDVRWLILLDHYPPNP